jgi:hypothetical protein
MTDKVIVILRDGSECSLFDWQKYYGLTPYSNAIGKHFSLNEARFQKDIQLFGKLVVNELLMRVLDRYREKVNQSVNLNSFNRNAAYQERLTAQGLRTAEFSPHEVFMAGDADTPGARELKKLRPYAAEDELWQLAVKVNRDHARIAREAGTDLGLKVRIGNEEYLRANQTFIHIDVCPEYYAPGKPFHTKPHPKQWELDLSW